MDNPVKKAFLDKYGIDTEILAFVEELNELAAVTLKATKIRRGGYTLETLAEIREKALKEYADVIFAFDFFTEFFDFSEDELCTAVNLVTEENRSKLEQ